MAFVNVTTTSPMSPPEATDLLLLWQLARTYPDFPENFVPPRDTDPNYAPPDQGNRIVAAAIAPVVVAIILVLCRIWVRLGGKSISFGLDDWMILPGTLLSIALACVQVVMVAHGGFGRHVYDNTWESVKLCVKFVYIHLILYYFALTFIKTSILAFIYRLTTPQDRWLRKIIWAYTVFLWLYLVVCCFVTSFECKPAAGTYDLVVRIHNPNCMNLPNAMLIINAVLVATDVLLVILPVQLVWNLRLPLRKRIAITALFSLGIFICVCNVLKMVNIKRAYNSYDFTWSGVDALLWSGVEASVAVIVATVPTLNILFLRFAPKLLGVDFTSKNSRTASFTQDTEMVDHHVERKLQSPVSNDERISIESAPQSSYDGHQAFGRELSLGSEPSERFFRSKRRGKRAIRTPSTLDGAMRNMWLESPGHSDKEGSDDAEETRSEYGSDTRQSWSPGYLRSNSLPGAQGYGRLDFRRSEMRMPSFNSRFDNYPKNRVRSMVAAGSGESTPNMQDGPSIWPRLKLGRKKSQTPGIMKTSEFSVKIDDQTQSQPDLHEDGIRRRDEVRITYANASEEEPDRQGIYMTSEIRVEHTDIQDHAYQPGDGPVPGDRHFNGNETFVEAERRLDSEDEPGPSMPAPAPEGIMKHSEIKLEYSRESDLEPDSDSMRRY